MGELTDGGGMHSGDEEDCSEELEGEHGDVGDVSTGWFTVGTRAHAHQSTTVPLRINPVCLD
jgi:hypothetical protein